MRRERRKPWMMILDFSRSCCLQQMCPVKLQDHLDLQSSRLTSYDLMKSEILAYIENVESRKEERQELHQWTSISSKGPQTSCSLRLQA